MREPDLGLGRDLLGVEDGWGTRSGARNTDKTFYRENLALAGGRNFNVVISIRSGVK